MSSPLALHVLEQIRAAGVRTICVCPGARNAEWVRLLAEDDLGFEVFWFYEERSAAFFALGRIRAAGLPAAVVTTSGTAAGELLPAAMEACYSGLPLFLLTADRPRRFRGSGAPQAAEQVGIFGVYAPTAFDLEDPERLAIPLEPGKKPVHLNVCFEDPKAPSSFNPMPSADLRRRAGVEVPESSQPAALFQEHLSKIHRPLVIVGALDKPDRPAVEQFLERLNAPVYLESLSGLRPSVTLDPIKLRVGDQLLRRANRSSYDPDGVIRIGGVPTHRFWRDLEDLGQDLPVLSLSPLEFSGLGRPSALVQADVSHTLQSATPNQIEGQSPEILLEEDRLLYGCLLSSLKSEPAAEPSLLRTLSESIPDDAAVYLGNSLPIREWDLASIWEHGRQEYFASRGLNGIDGQLSTFLGLCGPERPNWAILGDLTTLYDLSGPWPLSQMPANLDMNLLVVNNAGGKIFDRMFPTPQFQNPHNLSFEHWAAMWGLKYQCVSSPQEVRATANKPNCGLRVIELRPDARSTQRFWATYQEALG
jgi:2-succinyl-5-enolpyruvyl-6-hydroxy-3-cyclohexene-1-carboxylate synthase